MSGGGDTGLGLSVGDWVEYGGVDRDSPEYDIGRVVDAVGHMVVVRWHLAAERYNERPQTLRKLSDGETASVLAKLRRVEGA